ncbi:uncharacterized protein LOC124411574 isoform X1 [Diprion similis]|uniref:uncharacterized protein LOC124411574 isoform X1 n=1 Tax=Diprion similis TaxID=362088 RepID=UPI001EF84F48|nr:uncharacterized protein LOC124411574 isoform X1 [Diprion similis]
MLRNGLYPFEWVNVEKIYLGRLPKFENVRKSTEIIHFIRCSEQTNLQYKRVTEAFPLLSINENETWENDLARWWSFLCIAGGEAGWAHHGAGEQTMWREG